MAMTEVKLILSILPRHSRFRQIKRKVSCDGSRNVRRTCQNAAKWAFTPLTPREPWDGVGTRGNYCNVHLISLIARHRREYLVIMGWLKQQDDYVKGMRELNRVRFEKKYPRRTLRLGWVEDLGDGVEPIKFIRTWEVRHVSGPDRPKILVQRCPDYNEALRIARHFKR